MKTVFSKIDDGRWIRTRDFIAYEKLGFEVTTREN